MANESKAKLGAVDQSLTITLLSLASSIVGIGRQSGMEDNATTNLFQKVRIYAKITTGTSPTVDKSIRMYLILGDGHTTPFRSDGAGASDASLTVVNAQLIAAVSIKATSDKAYYLESIIDSPGDEWGVAVVHDTGVNLNSTAANHFVHFRGENPELQ